MLLGPRGTSSWLSCQEVSSAPELMRAAHSTPSNAHSLTHSWECWEEAAVLALAPSELCHGSKHPVFLPVCFMLKVPAHGLAARGQPCRICGGATGTGVRQLHPHSAGRSHVRTELLWWPELCPSGTASSQGVLPACQQQVPFLH